MEESKVLKMNKIKQICEYFDCVAGACQISLIVSQCVLVI